MLFTRDLRVRDNPALSAAVAAGPTVPLFVVDDGLGAAPRSANRQAFLLASLVDLDASLRSLGGGLVCRRGDFVDEALAIAKQVAADTIHVADDVSAFARSRLARLEAAAGRERVRVVRHPGVTVVPPGAVEPVGGGEFKVFTPYYRRWLEVPWRSQAATPSHFEPALAVSGGSLDDLLAALGGPATGTPAHGLPAGGETAGLDRLKSWAADHLHAYDARHDDLPRAATSQISPYLHFGCLSPGEVAARLLDRPGGAAFVRQLCWRDFYHQVLAARPDAAHADYRDRGDRWLADPEAIAAWKEGRTGYPVVDAGMRQLLAEGFMHNRARMVVASFLTKDLYVDWRVGAAHFMEHLVDADVANNQLNWQWTAGTGTDTNPHRIFNPITQGHRFDPHGHYVRRYVPELAGLRGKAVHDPTPAMRRASGYPAPLVDHHEAIAAYRARKATS